MHISSHLLAWSSISLVACLAIAGEVMIAAAMRQVGDLDDIRARAGLMGAIRAVLSNRTFLAGSFCMALNFFAMLYTLSLVELSLAAPGIASFTYIGNAIAAKIFLKEMWIGGAGWRALFVCAGVFLLSK